MADSAPVETTIPAHELHCLADCGFVQPPGIEAYALIPAMALVIAAVLIVLRRSKRRKAARSSSDD